MFSLLACWSFLAAVSLSLNTRGIGEEPGVLSRHISTPYSYEQPVSQKSKYASLVQRCEQDGVVHQSFVVAHKPDGPSRNAAQACCCLAWTVLD